MPRYKFQNGNRAPNKIKQSAWIEIPIKSNNELLLDSESYLIQPRVADYIVLLEKKLLKYVKELPKLSYKKK
jgi:hypothetical protein